jgi:hypothetical protein
MPQLITPAGASHDRYERRVRARIVSRSSGTALAGGEVVQVGEHLYDVTASEVERLRACVADPERIELARAHCARLDKEWEAKHGAAGIRLSPHSMEASYVTLFGRTPGWIEELEIIDESLPPLVSDEDRRLAAIAANAEAERARLARS